MPKGATWGDTGFRWTSAGPSPTSSPTTRSAGTYTAGKASTTPRDLTEGVFAALGTGRRLDLRRDLLLRARHDRRAERVPPAARREACCCSRREGVGDVYQIARGNRTQLYDLHYRKPQPLVPARRHRRDRGPARLARRGARRRSTRTPSAPPPARYATRASAPSRSRCSSASSTRPTSSGSRRSCARSSTESADLALAPRRARVARVRAHVVRRPRGLHRARRPRVTSSAWRTRWRAAGSPCRCT